MTFIYIQIPLLHSSALRCQAPRTDTLDYPTGCWVRPATHRVTSLSTTHNAWSSLGAPRPPAAGHSEPAEGAPRPRAVQQRPPSAVSEGSRLPPPPGWVSVHLTRGGGCPPGPGAPGKLPAAGPAAPRLTRQPFTPSPPDLSQENRPPALQRVWELFAAWKGWRERCEFWAQSLLWAAEHQSHPRVLGRTHCKPIFNIGPEPVPARKQLPYPLGKRWFKIGHPAIIKKQLFRKQIPKWARRGILKYHESFVTATDTKSCSGNLDLWVPKGSACKLCPFSTIHETSPILRLRKALINHEWKKFFLRVTVLS